MSEPTSVRRVAWRVLLFACLGLLLEVFFTAAWSACEGDPTLRAHTSPWMMLDYGLLGLLVGPVSRRIARLPLPLRAAVYMTGIFAVELASGWLFDLAGLRIWDYRGRTWNVGGYITLTYAPAWYALGLVLERLHAVLDRAAAHLAGERPGTSPPAGTVRPVVEGDIPQVLALVREVYAEYGQRLNTEEEPWWLSPGASFRDTGGEFWVVEADGVVRATAGVKLHEDDGELKCLYVHRSLRRQGWGRRLTVMAMEHARRARRTKFTLWSDTRFEEAHRLYESMGFRRTGFRDLHDSNNTQEHGFELTFGDPTAPSCRP